MTRADLDTQRALFEAWATSGIQKGPGMHRTGPDDPNEYQDNLVAAWWQAWQAALAAQAPAVQQESAGWLTGDSTSHRLGNLQDFTSSYEFALAKCDEHNRYYANDPDHIDRTPTPLYAAPSPQGDADVLKSQAGAVAELMEAWDFGQFSDDFNQPQAQNVRKAIRNILAAIDAARKEKP